MSWRGRKRGQEPRRADVSGELDTAERALEAYDYEAAEAALTLAFERSDGALEAARPWLAHLVDNVADDARALSLATKLSEESLGDPDVRRMLATAAARRQERSAARSWLAGVRAPAAADAWWALGRAAVSAGQLEEVREALDEIRALDPSCPGAVALGDALEVARGHARAPAEARLLSLREQSLREREPDVDRLLEAAQEVLRDHPESEVASRLVAQLGRELRRDEARVAAQEASRLLAAGRGSAALACFERARRLGPETPELSQGLAEARSMAEDQELERQTASLTALFGAADDDEARGQALVALLALSEAGRARVREQLEVPELEWLLAMAAPKGGSQAKQAVRAALAMRAAVAALRRDESATAAALLEPHRRWVERCPEGRALLARARRRVAERERARVSDALDEVARLLEESDVEAARDALGRVPATELGAEQQARRAELSSRVEAETERGRLERGVEEATARGRLSQAIAMCRELARHSAPRAEAQWRARAEELDGRLHRLLCFRVVPPDEAECPGPRVRSDPEEISRALGDAGRCAYVLRGAGRWILVCRLDVATGAVERAASMLFLEGTCPGLHVAEDHVEIVAESEIVRLTLDLDRLLAHHHLEPVGAHEIVEQLLVTEGDVVWTLLRHAETDEEEARVVCLNTRKVLRTRPGGIAFITGRGEHQRICIDGYDEGVQVYDAGGRRVCRIRLPEGGLLTGIGEAKEGGLWLLEYEDVVDPPLFVRRLREDGTLEPRHRVGGARGGACAAVLGLDGGCLVLAGERLCRFEATPDGGLRRTSTRAVGSVSLLSDGTGRHLVASSVGADGRPWLAPVDEELSFGAPAYAGPRERFGSNPLDMMSGPSNHAMERQAARQLARISPTSRDELLDDTGGWPVEKVVAFGNASRPFGLDPVPMLERHLARAPQHLGLALARAEAIEGRDGLEPAVAALGAGLEAARPDDPLRMDALVLRAKLELALGEVTAATRSVESALALAAPSDVERLVDTLDMLRVVYGPADASDHPRWGGMRRVLDAVREADALYAEGELEQALAALSTPDLWRGEGPQLAARRAAFWLELDPHGPASVQRDAALAAVIDDTAGARWGLHAVPGAHWGADRVQEVVAAATERLRWESRDHLEAHAPMLTRLDLALRAARRAGEEPATTPAFSLAAGPAGASLAPFDPAQAAFVVERLAAAGALELAEQPGISCRVERSRLRLVLSEGPGALRVRLKVDGMPIDTATLSALLQGPMPCMIADTRPSREPRCLIVDMDLARGEVALAVAAFDGAPEVALAELVARLPALLAFFDLELPARFAGPRVAPVSEPILLLERRALGAFRAALGVRPAEGGGLEVPGRGALTAFGVTDGALVHTERDLEQERALAEAARATLELPSEVTQGDALVASLAQGGGLIARASEAGVRVQWRGRPLKVRSSVRSLKLRVARSHDLFAIDGSLELDGASVALAVVLTAAREGERFVELRRDEVLGLGEVVRQRLLALDAQLVRTPTGLGCREAIAPTLAQLLADDELDVSVELDRDAATLVSRWRGSQSDETAHPVPPGFVGELRPYQREGFEWMSRLAAWGSGGCLADDMGLGKTIQALCFACSRAARGPQLVVAPSSVCGQWAREAARFAPGLRVLDYRGSQRATLLEDLGPSDLVVTSYGVLARDAEELSQRRFATLLLDEAQRVKNARAVRSRAVRRLDVEVAFALTGTPVENHLGELWSIFRVVAPGVLGSWPRFRRAFSSTADPDDDRARRSALGRLLSPLLLRRTKASVAPELPPRLVQTRMVESSAAERALYELARREALGELELRRGPKRMQVLAALTHLRQLVCAPTLVDPEWDVRSTKAQTILDLVAQQRAVGERVLIFSQFVRFLELLSPELLAAGHRLARLDGSMSATRREREIEAFQQGGATVMLVSLMAGGVGLNLTAASTVIHADPWWNPAVEDQATDRAHRIGQRRPVTVFRLVTAGTIEEQILRIHASKRALVREALEQDSSASGGGMSEAELLSLLSEG